MSGKIDLFSNVAVMDIIFSKVFLPFLSLECYRKRPWHLYSFTDRKIRSSFLVEKSQYFIIKIDSRKRELNLTNFIKLLQSNIFNFIHIFLAFKLFLDLYLLFFTINLPLLKKFHDLILLLLIFWMLFHVIFIKVFDKIIFNDMGC